MNTVNELFYSVGLLLFTKSKRTLIDGKLRRDNFFNMFCRKLSNKEMSHKGLATIFLTRMHNKDKHDLLGKG